MQLTRYTDYALRTLMYLSARPDRLVPITEISRAFGISHSHLTKVTHDLAKRGFVSSVRGRNGGLRLTQSPSEIGVGTVVRATEDSFRLADCGSCIIAPACGMMSVFDEAVHAFLAVLDRYTFATLPARDLGLLDILPEPGQPNEPAT